MKSQTVEDVIVADLEQAKKAVGPYEVNGTARDLLLRGIKELHAAHAEYIETLADIRDAKDAMGGYAPALPKDPLVCRHWVDDIIKRRLGGTRDKLLVKWSFADSSYTWDPIGKAFIKC